MQLIGQIIYSLVVRQQLNDANSQVEHREYLDHRLEFDHCQYRIDDREDEQ